jgi:transcriptional regulator with XRE-family HTH domain
MLSKRVSDTIRTRTGEGMADMTAGSTVPRRQLGRYLRDLRNAAGLTVKDAARGLEWSEAKMWRIETGQNSLRSFDVEIMCRLYRADARTTAALMGLAKETKAKGWWHAYGDAVPEHFDLYVGLEAAAAKLSTYESDLVPGLLQTGEYTRALAERGNPDEDDAAIDRRVQLRTARQAILRRPIDPPALEVALSETVLRRPVGGPEVMAAQLARLTEASELPNVSLRVVPFAAGLNAGVLTGAFTILRFPLNGGGAESEPPTVFADGYTGDLYLDKSHEIDRYVAAFKDIWQAALDEDASRDLILKTAEELRRNG